jgi:hypothetical protein
MLDEITRLSTLERDAARMRAIDEAADALRDRLEVSTRTRNLRDALIGQHSDVTFYSEWERNKAMLVTLLDAIDRAALTPSPETSK